MIFKIMKQHVVIKYLGVEVSKIIFCLPHWLLSLEKSYFLSQIIVLNLLSFIGTVVSVYIQEYRKTRLPLT